MEYQFLVVKGKRKGRGKVSGSNLEINAKIYKQRDVLSGQKVSERKKQHGRGKKEKRQITQSDPFTLKLVIAK